jgi:hypothetical protein
VPVMFRVLPALSMLLLVSALSPEALGKECRNSVPCGNSCIPTWKTCNINVRASHQGQAVPQISWKLVDSSFIEKIGFRSNVSQICVRMINRTAPIYCYQGDSETFSEFLNASSKGQFYNSMIKPRGEVARFYD